MLHRVYRVLTYYVCTPMKTVCLIETVRKIFCLENFQCTVLLIETKRKICNSTFNRTVCLIESTEYVLCLLTEQGIVLSQAEQFDVLDLYKTPTQDVQSSYFGSIGGKINGSN